MDGIFHQEVFHISSLQTDAFGRAKPSALLHMIQQAAGSHCRLLAADRDTLCQRGLFWAVTRNRVQVTRLPRLGETVTVKTWPMPTTRVAYPRAVAAFDREGNELFRSVSLWVLMDMQTRAMVLPDKSGVTVAGILTGTELSVPHAIAARPLEDRVCRQVGYTLLDENGHMNNARYMDWVDDLLPAAFHREHPVREFTLCYLNEALEADRINLHYALCEDLTLLVDARREQDGQDKRIFSAQVLF